MTHEELVICVGKAICKSRTCEGFACCQWPANMGRLHNCPVAKGNYDDAANAAIAEVLAALQWPTPSMKQAAADVIGNYDIGHEAINRAISASPLVEGKQ